MDNVVSKTYVTTDTHFYHDKIIEYCNRPPNYQDLIINNWKNEIKKEDIIFHLGDVTWGSKEQLKDIMDDLPGTKILIRGNHDRSHSNNWFISCGFSAVLEKAQVSGILFSHMPSFLHEKEIERGVINVFGHFHNNPPEKWDERFKERMTQNHYLLSLEDVDYNPISIENIQKRKFIINSINKIKNLQNS